MYERQGKGVRHTGDYPTFFVPCLLKCVCVCTRAWTYERQGKGVQDTGEGKERGGPAAEGRAFCCVQ